jgi:hypothetical protein
MRESIHGWHCLVYTTVSGQDDIVDLALGPRTQIDHFADMRKMVPRFVSRVLTSGYGFINNGGKALPLGIPQQHLQVAGAPILRSGIGEFPYHILKTGMVPYDDFFIHAVSPSRIILM